MCVCVCVSVSVSVFVSVFVSMSVCLCLCDCVCALFFQLKKDAEFFSYHPLSISPSKLDELPQAGKVQHKLGREM